VAEERRRIARDVHDLVGHGLAAALVQIASARHVLRRDPEAADQALALAEKAGRASMQELRSTLTTLREGDADTASLPSAADIPALVEAARADGLPVTLRLVGDPARLEGVVGVTLYRIAQEGLANALRHAPRAETVIELDSSDDRARLSLLSRGASYDAPGHPTFGLRGMTERAAAVRGTATAGATVDGWLVEAILPTEVTG
jgi:signal transduction histidine kinase